jgi:hypothetical protein
MTENATTETINIAPVVRDEAHAARIYAAMRDLDAARATVCDAARAWDEACGLRGPSDAEHGDDDGRAMAAECRQDLRDALHAWREASEALLRAMSGRP